MIKINRKTEYSLIALRYLATLAKKPDNLGVASVREIADAYRIPYAILSKTLQQLQRHGIVESVQGLKGGYKLKRALNSVTIGEVMEVFEGPLALTDCLGARSILCLQSDICNVKSLFTNVHNKIARVLQETTLEDLAPKTDNLTELKHDYLN